MYTRQHNSVSSTIILKDILLIVTCYFYVALLLIFYIEFKKIFHNNFISYFFYHDSLYTMENMTCGRCFQSYLLDGISHPAFGVSTIVN